MRKILLLGTIFVTGTAFAFGGFGVGSKSSSQKIGVDAIGVHINHTKSAKDKGNIAISCPEHSSSDESSPECVCEKGYEMVETICRPSWPSTCAANGLYWCPNSQTCGESKECLALCPEDRLCGPEGNQVCCGEGNVCDAVLGRCCDKNYNGEEEMCCDFPSLGAGNDGEWLCCDPESRPFVSVSGDDYSRQCCPNNSLTTNVGGRSVCCEEGSSAYTSYYENNGEDSYVEVGCCDGQVIKAEEGVGEEEGSTWYRQVCCKEAPIGKVWQDDSGRSVSMCGDCASNADCDSGYYCNLTGDDRCAPTHGMCVPIGSSQSADIANLGQVILSDDWRLTWWSAQNWCQAQNKNLINVADLNCYNENTNMKLEMGSYGASCCAENHQCKTGPGAWKVVEDYSPILAAIRTAFGDKDFWVRPAENCNAYFMHTEYGNMIGGGKSGTKRALCR